MVIDDKATQLARKKHERGVKFLNELFGFDHHRVVGNPQTGHSFPDAKTRRMWREWRDKTFPARVKRRKLRKTQRASRRKNRA